MAASKLRVVFDCNIFWRAFFSRHGIGAECKKLIDDDIILHFISDEIIAELTDVLTRPTSLEKYSDFTIEDVEAFLKEITSGSLLVKSVPKTFEIFRDIKDEPYVNLAAEVKADFIVTTDNDLLALMTGIDADSKQFRQRFRHLKIVTPSDFLNFVGASKIALKP
jgi:putative PIN family toxin of toxin-antitoxin system